jgi:hypothetical protein
MTLLLLFAAACSDGMRVDPSTATIAAGQTITLEAHRIPSTYQGIPWAPNRIEFGGEGAAVSAAGVMEARENVAGIVVQGLEPGTATIVSRHYDSHTPGLVTNAVATVTVVACLRGPTLTPQFATTQGRVNEPVLLHVESSSPVGMYQWYAGARGDASHPIPSTNALSTGFVPRAPGSYSFWVRETTECGTADAECVVNVGPQRRRAVGH